MRNDPANMSLEKSEWSETWQTLYHNSSGGLTKLEYTAIQLMASYLSSGKQASLEYIEGAVFAAHALWDELEKK